MSTTGQTALLLGATGQVGQNILRELLSSPHFTKIGEFGRKVTDISGEPQSKLVQKTIDFEKLEDAGLGKEKWDVVFIASVFSYR
jgi:oxidoreductase